MEAVALDLAPKVADVWLAQGVIGSVALVLLAATICLFLLREKDKKEHAKALADATEAYTKDIEERDERHALEMAAERKLNAELQNARNAELRLCIEATNKGAASVADVTRQYQIFLGALERFGPFGPQLQRLERQES